MAKGLWVWAQNAIQKAAGLWVTVNDGSGNFTYKQAKSASVYTNGAWQKFWPSNGSIKLTAAPPTNTASLPSWSAINLSWTAGYAQKISVTDTTTQTVLYTTNYTGVDQDGVTGSYTHAVLPNETHSYRADITDLNGDIYSSVATTSTPQIPTPTALAWQVSGTLGSVVANKWPWTLTWTGVTGATGYIIRWTVKGVAQTNIVTSTTSVSSSAAQNIDPNTAYSFQITAYWTKSGVTYESDPLTITGTTAVGPQGSNDYYYYRPTSTAVWQAGTGSNGTAAPGWRTDTPYLRHGTATTTYPNDHARGMQTSLFFGYKRLNVNTFNVGTSAPTELAAGVNSVASIEVYVYLGATKTASAANRFVTHKHASKPTGAPTTSSAISSSMAVANQPAANKAGWLPISATYGKNIINGTISGFGWGHSTKDYMVGHYTTATNTAATTKYPIGTIRIKFSS